MVTKQIRLRDLEGDEKIKASIEKFVGMKNPIIEIEESKVEEKDDRPVNCYICKKKMFYKGHRKHEPEFTIEGKKGASEYLHLKCITTKVLKVKK